MTADAAPRVIAAGTHAYRGTSRSEHLVEARWQPHEGVRLRAWRMPTARGTDLMAPA